MRAASAPPPEFELLDETAAWALRGLSDGVDEDRNPKLPTSEGFRDLVDDAEEDGGVEVVMEKEVAAAAAMIVKWKADKSKCYRERGIRGRKCDMESSFL